MIKHIIILGSSYKTGKRIALDYTNFNDAYYDFLVDSNIISKKYPIATHTITTNSESWDDVRRTDPFFENVQLVKSKAEFLGYLSDDSEINTNDIANYILSYIDGCTHIRLEKLLYFCYADYLCKYNKKLFNDKIYAFKYGPVIGSIYNEYRGTSEIITNIAKDYKLPVQSRILNSKNGLEKINSMNRTLEKYKRFNTNTLISLTHGKNTPWTHNDYSAAPYKEISDEDIIKYHKYEEI